MFIYCLAMSQRNAVARGFGKQSGTGPGMFLGNLIGYGLAYFEVLLDAVRYLPSVFRKPTSRIFLKQIYFTGIEALPLLAATALLGGYLTIQQLFLLLGKDMAMTPELVRVLLVRDGSVAFVAAYVLARSGSAMASELAGMRQRGEIATLYRMGIDPGCYLVAPRVLATSLSVAALTVYFQVIMVFGGFALMSLFQSWDYLGSLENFARKIDPFDALVTVIQTTIFGAVIGTVACLQGLRAGDGPTGIPVATRTALVHGFAGIILVAALAALFSGP